MATEDNEVSFRNFANALLAIEEIVHRSGKVPLYTPNALQDILESFCDIIASHLEAQSCTIQLKLQDVESCKFIEKMTQSAATPHYDNKKSHGRTTDEIDQIKQYRELVARDFRKRWNDAGGGYSVPPPSDPAKDDTARRNVVLRTPGTFPYCVYPKGAMWLVAANKTSPWTPFVDWLITDLRTGVTAEIVQEKSPRVRDPFSIRKSRNFRKLGPVDPWLWTNKRPVRMRPDNSSPRYFLNYYAVPIRIHSGGDVIGILKIENKGFAYHGLIPNGNPEKDRAEPPRQLHGALNRIVQAPHSSTFREMRDTLAGYIDLASEEARQFDEEGKPSLVSLVTLAWDLSHCPAPENGTIEQFLTATYGDPVAGASENPPVQVLFDKIEQEDAFFMCDGTPANSRRPDLEVISTFYEKLNEHVAERRRDLRVQQQLEEAIGAFVRGRDPGGSARVVDAGTAYPDFFHRVTTTCHGFELTFHVQVCPPPAHSADIGLLVDYYHLDEARAQKYHDSRRAQDSCADLDCEYILDTDRVVHLRTDRLAARIQSLTYAFPVPPFLPTDSRKLSWAALEIGKLIERQVSYRGTHAAPTVPLTADDFFRIPISDLSFVDAIRVQHNNAQVLADSLRYHLPNLCKDLEFTWGIEHSQRVKSLRSYFDRIGQSHRAEYDALIALWSYLLHRRMTQDERAAISAAAPRLMELLKQLVDGIAAVWAENPSDCPPDWKEAAGQWLEKPQRIFPDLRFSAPALDLRQEERRERALQRLRKNLSRCPTGVAPPDLHTDFTDHDLVELLFRRYDAFIVRAISLYLQLRNEGLESGYTEFYRTTRDILDRLRNRLELLEEQVTRAPQSESAVGRLSKTIGELRVEVLSLSTRDLAEKLSAIKPADEKLKDHKRKDEELLRFSVQGIYKRIRTLATISGNQCAPSLLNWENGRFDYLGARLTCLFKNQVFATYEEVWRRGDPFRPKSVAGAQSGSRQRWICIRTRVHSGDSGYHAWQVSALMDPLAVKDSYWDNNAYTLNMLREILAISHREWSGDIDTYELVARCRGDLKEQYSDWFCYATKLLDRQPAACPRPSGRLFGEYLGEWPLDILVRLIKDDTDPDRGGRPAVLTADLLNEILNILRRYAEAASVYSNTVRQTIQGRAPRQNYAASGSELMAAGKALYDWALRLIEDDTLPLSKDIRNSKSGLTKQQQAIFETEWTRPRSPLVFMPKDAVTEIDEVRTWIGRDVTRRDLAKLGAVIRYIQGSQMDYLFDLPEKDAEFPEKAAKAPPRRGQADVMDRILCYVLLHGTEVSELISGSSKIDDSYNLFHYLMSLVPVEIQMRTSLANTMAEQYHRIYKIGTDALSETRIQQDRLIDIAKDLDVIDRIFEVQFEDYIAQKSI